uniref:Uncharacterized protein n=1 Tax=Arundo donax TaxID=35708 RepID=A0A0A8Z0D9_ARUDO
MSYVGLHLLAMQYLHQIITTILFELSMCHWYRLFV